MNNITGRKSNRRVPITRIAFFILSFGFATGALAQEPTISSVMVTNDKSLQINIAGENLSYGSDAVVSLGTIGTLAVDSQSSAELVVSAVSAVPNGDYVLTVTTSTGTVKYGLTIGAAGRLGPLASPVQTNAFEGPVNTGYGIGVLANNTGSHNSGFGRNALRDNTSGSSNTAMGALALQKNTTGKNNTASGVNALNSNTTGNSNTANGYFALLKNTTGINNTATGSGALLRNTTGRNNTASGVQALRNNTTGNNNTASGVAALADNTTGKFNTASGYLALLSNTTGDKNTASGSRALLRNTTGFENTASGYEALNSNTTGFENTANGNLALRNNSTGRLNTASGVATLHSNTTGRQNTGIGVSAIFSNTTGDSNSALGHGALFQNNGTANTAIGASALANNTTGGRNIALGASAGFLTDGELNIVIGNFGVAAESRTIRIGDDQTRAFVAGIRGTTTDIADAVTIMIDSNGQLGTVSSSMRYKEDVADMAMASEPLLSLRPVTFRYKKPYADGDKPIQYGLIAEEVAEQFPELVVFNEEGQAETVKYQLLSVLLLNELKKQQGALHQQRDLNELQELQLTRQENLLTELQSQSQEIEALKAQLAELQGLRETLDILIIERTALASVSRAK